MIALIALAALSIDSSRASQIFHELATLSNRDGGALWGKPLYGPMLFVDERTNEVVGNEPAEGLTRQGEVYVGKLPSNLAPANTALEWSGKNWTMIMWPLPDLPHARGRLGMHECFHRIQASLGFPLGDVAIEHLDSLNGRIWMRLEMRALAEALENSNTEARHRCIRDAIDFRMHRRQLCGSDAEQRERKLEMHEGLAEYTGLKLSGYPQPSLDDRAAVRLDQEQASPNFARSFAYATGPAYGLLLDDAGVAWRKGLKPTDELSAILAKAIGYQASSEDLDSRAAAYDGAYVVAQETQKAADTAAKISEYKARFIDGPVLDLPVGQSLNYSYDPLQVVAFPGQGQVLSGAKITDDWGVLNVTGTVLLRRDSQSRIIGVVVQAPKAGALSTDSWTLELAKGWTLVKGPRDGDWRVAKG